jgi:2-polyprenyl-6-methoxyphenol hydroxylase-like FAD-dependent oxidoreductase
MTKALIIGGGIAGPVTAMALQKAGITSAVYEARPVDAPDTGAFLLLSANGMEALRTIDAHEPVVENSFPAGRVDYISNTGKPLGGRPLGVAEDGGLGPRTLKRSTLHRVLWEEAARRGIQMERGKRLLAAQTGPEGQIVGSFADSGRALGDVLIGADGLHSLIRRTIDAASPRPRYTGQTTVCGSTRDAASPPAESTYTTIYGKRAAMGCTVTPDGEVWWSAHVTGPELSREELAAVTPKQWRERVTELFEGDNTPAADIVRSTGDAVTGCNAYDMDCAPTWSDETMVIVGDAAHASASHLGQGASMAVEDGVVLAKCLRDLRLPRHAFAAYERLRRPRVDRVMAAGARAVRNTATGLVKRALRDAMLPRQLERSRPGADSWLTGYRIDWDEPVVGVPAGQRR